MKKVIISRNRITRESKSNPQQNKDLKERMIKSQCINYHGNITFLCLGNGYLKITAIDPRKTVK